jgi:hypothetical protein
MGRISNFHRLGKNSRICFQLELLKL